ncbi:MAG TPA: LysR substrate-binding domain-containing protein [Xanthobacteraceae bacterium]|nr:LysR substrate-binding domain-containing protein [Xanthobacteraceae bacterium]
MVTLRQLRYLDALAQHRHFGRAAEACAVTQPALSMQIRDLEKTLGVQLVERRPGDVSLTEIGREVAQRGERLLAAARDLVDFARHRGRLLAGRMQLGVIPSLGPYVLPKILPVLQGRYPDLRVELRETQTKLLLEELVRGSLDVVMLALPASPAESELESLRLFEDPFLLAVPATDPRPATLRVTSRDIDQERLILLEEGHCLRDQALAYCARARQDAAMGLGATSLATVMQMVANGYGVTLVPQVAIDVEVRDQRVKLLRFAAPEPGRTIGLAWRRTSPRKVDFIALGQLIVDTLGVAARLRGRASSKPEAVRARKAGAARRPRAAVGKQT